MASKASTLGDPRRPAEIKKYMRTPSADDDMPSPLMLLGLMLAMGAMLLKLKILSWAAIFLALASAAHLKSDSGDHKQVVMTIVFAGMGILNSYFQPTPAYRTQPAGA